MSIFKKMVLATAGIASGADSQAFNFMETVAIAAFGGILGVLFTIPLRRALIVEQPLMFPEGVATGEVLKAGTEGGEGVRAIAVAAMILSGFSPMAGSNSVAVNSERTVIEVGEFRRICSPVDDDGTPWWINDHCFGKGTNGTNTVIVIVVNTGNGCRRISM